MTTILYIEDDPDHRLMMRTILITRGFKLETAPNGVEGVEMARQITPDLILLDLYMPKMDGFGVMRQLSQDPVTRDIPVIVVSAWPTGDHRRRAREAGAVAFLAKPYNPETLFDLIQKNLPRPKASFFAAPDTQPLEELSA